MQHPFRLSDSSEFPRSVEMRSIPVAGSSVASLKTVFAILMGLSVTNTLVVLIRNSRGSSPITLLEHLPALHSAFAAVLLFTIVRFYLGNMRHVDDFYVAGTVNGKALEPTLNTAAYFIVDFTVLIVQALLFGLASFYIVHAADFTLILTALLVVDILWTATALGVSPHQRLWFANNLGHFIALIICYGVHLGSRHSSVPFWLIVGFLATNGSIDFISNRAFYFADLKGARAIFLSAPFTQLLVGGRIPIAMREELNAVADHLEAAGWSVANAHKRERWGASLDSPRQALVADLQAIADAEILVAIIGSPASPGVQVEIGYALAKAKKIVVVADADDPMPYLVRGAVERNTVRLVRRSKDGVAGLGELLEGIDDALSRVGSVTSRR